MDLKARSGQNSDIHELTGLEVPLTISQGGTGASNRDTARTNLDAQQQNVHLDDLSDGELSATAVEHGTWFIDNSGDPGQMWAWVLQDTLLDYDAITNKYGSWIDGGDITRVYTEEGMGLFVGGNGSYAQGAGEVEILVDAGTDVDQIPRLVENPDGGGGGSLPVVDGSQLYGLDATQILSTKIGDGVPATPGPVSNEQFELLSDLRTDPDADHPVEDYTHGDVQAQFDNKQQQSDVLDDIVDATEANVAEYDLLIYKTNEDDGSWELLKSDDEEYHITASRVEHGDFFISEAGIAGDIWMSDGSEAGAWWKAGVYLTIGNDTLNVNVGTAANQVVALNAEAQLPAVDASLLVGLAAEQINVVGGVPSVTNEEFNALGDLRLESTDETEAEDNWRLTYGIVQDQLDDKQNGNANLDDLADGELTYDKVEFGEFFIKQAGDDDKVWTWVGTEADGVGSWVMPPGAQRLNDLMDASTMPLAGDDESSDNVFIGEGSGNTIDGGGGNGNLNTALGRNTLASLEDGNLNVAIGKDAGQNFVDGNGNILIGFNAGKDLGINESNKLIINNNNSADLVINPLIEGDFVAGEVLINNSLYSTNSLHLGSSTDSKFTIVQNEGDITIKSEEEGKKISFAVNGDDELLIMETVDGEEVIQLIGTTKIVSDETNATYINIDESGANLNLTGQEDVVVSATQDVVVNATEDVVVNATEEFTLNGNNISLTGAEIITIKNESGQDNKISFVVDDENELLKMESDGIIKLIGETKIAADDNTDSYINASESGTRLNVKGADKVLVHALNGSDGVVQILAADSINLDAQNVVITSGNEFTVDSDFKARGKVTIVDGSDSLSIHGDHAEGVTISNEFADRDIIFEIETGEVMRLVDNDGNANEALRLNSYNHLEFGQTDLSIKANSESQLAIRNNLDDGEILFKVSEDQVLKLNGDAAGAHSVEIDATTLDIDVTTLDIDATTVDIDAALTDVSNNLLVGDTLKVGAGDNILTVSQANGDVFVNNNALNKDVVFNVTRSGSDEAMRIDGQDLFLNVTNKIKVTNDDPDNADPLAGSELQFVNTGLPDNTGVTDDKPLATISAQADGVVSSKILMEDAIAVHGNQGVISFDVMVDGNLVTLMEMNTPSRELATNYDSTITIPHNMDVIGDLYTNTMEFAERIVPDDPGGATIGTELLPWGDLYLYDGNGTGAPQ